MGHGMISGFFLELEGYVPGQPVRKSTPYRIPMNPQKKIKRFESKPYRDFVSRHRCEVGVDCCLYDKTDPHHEPKNGHGKMGGKCDDTRCIPLCRKHHTERESPNSGKKSFYNKYYWVRPRETMIKLLTEYISMKEV